MSMKDRSGSTPRISPRPGTWASGVAQQARAMAAGSAHFLLRVQEQSRTIKHAIGIAEHMDSLNDRSSPCLSPTSLSP